RVRILPPFKNKRFESPCFGTGTLGRTFIFRSPQHGLDVSYIVPVDRDAVVRQVEGSAHVLFPAHVSLRPSSWFLLLEKSEPRPPAAPPSSGTRHLCSRTHRPSSVGSASPAFPSRPPRPLRRRRRTRRWCRGGSSGARNRSCW